MKLHCYAMLNRYIAESDSANASLMNVKKPLVSVIMPTRNPRLDWLERSIASAFNEPDCRIELIVVDDGSDTPLDSMLAGRLRDGVRVLRVPHGGPSKARNAGIAASHGQFLRFMDDDDEIVAGSTSVLLALCGSEHDVVAYGVTCECDVDLRPTRRVASRLTGTIHVAAALGRFYAMFQAMLLPRAVVDTAGPFREDLLVQGDWEFVLRVTESARFVRTPAVVYLYRRYGTSHSSRRDARRDAIKSTVLTVREYLARHPELRGTLSERRIRAYAQFLIGGLLGPRYPERSRRFWRAMAADPLRGSVILVSRLGSRMLRGIRGL